MRKYLLILSLFFSISLFGQGGSKAQSKIALGISFSPDYSYHTIIATDEQSEMIKEIINFIDSPKFGYTIGARLFYHFHEKFSFETGLLFSDKGDKEEPMKLTGPIGSDDPYFENVENIIFIQHDYYVDIPAKINFRIAGRRLSMFASAGVATNIYFTSTSTTVRYFTDGSKDEDRDTNKNDYFRKVNFSGLIGLGMDFKISNHFIARVEPTFRHFIFSMTDSNLKTYYYSLGVNCGVYYSF